MQKELINVRLGDDGAHIVIIDQTLLPNELKYIELREECEMCEAIKKLRVRGAPAIGIFVGFAMYVLAQKHEHEPRERFTDELVRIGASLVSTRPTAKNLSWAVERMIRTAKAAGGESTGALRAMKSECAAIYDEDVAMCKAISEYGLTLIRDGCTVLTHCNAGPLATSRYGTALGPLLLGRERGMNFKVFADETRPLLQGARLTSYELYNAGIDVTLICDNMAGMVMKQGLVDAIFVGCDRIAANGDAANKIGTGSLAVLAKYYNVPFYVLGPSSTLDMSTKTGADIEIELREGDEIRSMFYEKPMALSGVKCYNPAFDVVDNSLISAIVTEKGIIRAPYDKALAKLFG